MTRLEKVMQSIKIDSELLEPHQVTRLKHYIENGLFDYACIRVLGIAEPRCAEQDWTCGRCWQTEVDS